MPTENVDSWHCKIAYTLLKYLIPLTALVIIVAVCTNLNDGEESTTPTSTITQPTRTSSPPATQRPTRRNSTPIARPTPTANNEDARDRWLELQKHRATYQNFVAAINPSLMDRQIDTNEAAFICRNHGRWERELTDIIEAVRNFRKDYPNSAQSNAGFLTELATRANEGLGVLAQAPCP